MNTFKLIGACAVMASCTALGFAKSLALKRRTETISSFIRAVNLFKSEVSFMKNGLYDIFLRTAAAGILPVFFKDAASMLKTDGMEAAWRQAMQNSRRALALTDADVEILSIIGSTLGKSGARNEAEGLDNVRILLEEQYRDALKTYERDASLWRNAGAVLGAAAAIILF